MPVSKVESVHRHNVVKAIDQIQVGNVHLCRRCTTDGWHCFRFQLLPVGIHDIRMTVKSFMARCDIPYVAHVPYDHELEAAVRAEGARRGYSMEGPKSIEPYIPLGVMAVATSFAHLPSKPTQVHLCLWASLGVYVDDAFEKDVDAMAGFNERFYSKQPQRDKVLEDWADLLRRTPEYFVSIPSTYVAGLSDN